MTQDTPRLPPDWVMVPKEPTEEMLDAGEANNPTSWAHDTDRGFPRDVANDVYRAMLTAAPAQAPAALDVKAMLKLKFADILSPAIDARAPYAKVMINMLVEEAASAYRILEGGVK